LLAETYLYLTLLTYVNVLVAVKIKPQSRIVGRYSSLSSILNNYISSRKCKIWHC